MIISGFFPLHEWSRVSLFKDTWLLRSCLVVLLSALCAPSVPAMPRIFPTGVTTYDPAHAYNSYVIFGSPDGKTHLIDMNGNEVHEWRHSGFPSEMLDPKVTDGKLGHVLVQLKGQGFNNKTIAELDWDGNVVWQWGEKAPGGAANLALRY